jgi:hypothetical protein
MQHVLCVGRTVCIFGRIRIARWLVSASLICTFTLIMFPPRRAAAEAAAAAAACACSRKIPWSAFQ